jgi:hypothetical protein
LPVTSPRAQARVHHRRREAEIIRRIGHAVQRRAIEIERRHVAAARDLVRGLRRNDAATRFRFSERDLDLGAARDQREVGKNRPHALGAESVAEQQRVEDGGRGGHGHGRFLDRAGGERIRRGGNNVGLADF